MLPVTLIFGNLTTAFTRFGAIQLEYRTANSADMSGVAARLYQAREDLKRVASKDALYLVYIGKCRS